MPAQRRRVCSFSSNETILEAYSSSPSSPTEPADSTSTWQLSARDLIKPLCRGLTSGSKSTSKARGRDVVTLTEKTKTRGEQNRKVLEDKEQDADDSEQSIDWDEDPEEEEQQLRRHRREPKKKSSYPQTMGFWLDWWLADVATAAVDADLKALCASMMLWRGKNEIVQVPTHPVRSYQHSMQQEFSCPPPSTAYGANTLRNSDGSFVFQTHWDMLLQEMRIMAREMHQSRKWRTKGRKNAAGWCKWGAKERVKERGEFVEEVEVGYEVERGVEGEKWVVKLGYRRNDAVVGDVCLDGDAGGKVAGR